MRVYGLENRLALSKCFTVNRTLLSAANCLKGPRPFTKAVK